MRDLKISSSDGLRKAPAKARANRRKSEKKPFDVRNFLHRTLRLLVIGCSLVLLVIGVALLVQVMLASDLFRIDDIRVVGAQRLSEENIKALSDIQPGVSTFALDLALISRKIEENAWVHQARIERIFPRQLNIVVKERRPLAIINLGYLYYLDENAEVFKVLGADDGLDFPVISGFDRETLLQDPALGQRQLAQIVALIEDLAQRQTFNLAQVSEIHREAKGGLSLFTLVGSVRIKIGEDQFSAKLDRLEKVYPRLKSRLELLAYIDLNVDRRVIVQIEGQPPGAAS
jgi:cell division protein FtsQ